MIRIGGQVTYADGRTTHYEATQREFAAWERYALRSGLPTAGDPKAGTGAPLTMTRYLAWAAIQRGDEDPVSFDVWDAMVAEVTADEGAETVADPTPADRSAG